MKILVTGAGGMLGSAVVPALVDAGHTVVATDLRVPADGPAWNGHGSPLTPLDVRSSAEVAHQFTRTNPTFVVHLAAETDLEVCEAEPEHAFTTNALGTKHVALACQAADIPLMYVSSAGVFDGRKESAYTELDDPCPINMYAHSKFEGELYVQTYLSRYYIVRAGWMVGGGRKDHKFVAKILAQVRDGAQVIYAVGDKLGTPTYAPDFAGCFARLMETDSFGLYHMACQGQASRYDVARKILEVLGRTDVQLVKVGSDFFRDDYPVRRPASEIMRNLMLEVHGMNTMRPWEESLEEYLQTAFADLQVAPDMSEQFVGVM
jgi:dTDP-4-dehydrorhamnose reductase